MAVRIEPGDCLEVIPRLVAEGVVCDAVVTDPPYGLEFMGRDWDKLDGGLPQEAVWKGRRGQGSSAIGTDDSKPATRHHVSYGVKKSAFRRCVVCGKRQFSGSPCQCPVPSWIVEYPDGAPSSAIRMQRWHEQWAREAYHVLKPGGFLLAFGGTRTYHRLVSALEDAGLVIQDTIAWVYGSGFPKNKVQLKPSFEPICLAYKPGGKRTMQVDECRIPTSQEDQEYISERINGFNNTRSIGGNGAYSGGKVMDRGAAYDASKGRWPANLCHDGSDEVLAGFPDAGGGFGKRGGERHSEYGFAGTMQEVGFGDTGSAARFFYTAKADKQDRWGSRHPTVKPIDLIRWLVRLVTPPGGLVLDPFAGSGTTGAAAFAEGRNAILIEREDQYVADIRERMAFYAGDGRHSLAAKARRTEQKPIGGLFDRPYDESADLAGSYYAAVEEIGRRVKAGEPVPDCMVRRP